jgi:uncharacterized membrane protein
MDKVVAVVFNDEKQAYEGLRAFRDLHADGSITLYSNAVVAKDPNGTLSVREGDEVLEGTFVGLLTGSLIGILGGPIGVAVGASTGTMIGATFDLARTGISSDFLQEMSEYLLPGKTAVITEIDEDWQAPIDTRMEALADTSSGAIGSRSRTPTTQDKSRRTGRSWPRWRRSSRKPPRSGRPGSKRESRTLATSFRTNGMS